MQRRFLGWTAPALPLAAEHLLDHYAGNGSVEMSEALLVLPGRRGGRRLLELLAEGAEVRDLPLRPPRVTTVGGVPKLLAPPLRPEPPAFLLRRHWAQALRSLPGETLETLLARPPGKGDLAGWMSLARMVDDLHRTVGAEGHRFHQVAEACAEGLLFNDEERWRALAWVQDRVLEALDQAGLRDRQTHRRRVAGGEPPAEGGFQGDLWLVGVAEMPGIVRRILARRGERVCLRALVHAPDALAESFDELGCVRPEVWAQGRAELPDEAIRMVGGPADQADQVVRELRRLGARRSAEEVTVGVPDPGVVPFVKDRLAVEGLAVREASGRPVEETLPFRLLHVVAEYLAEESWSAFAAFLRHPDVRSEAADGAGEGTAPVPLADRYHGLHLPALLGSGPLPEGGERDSRPLAGPLREVRDRLRNGLLKGLTGTRPLSGWREPVEGLLLRVYGEGELDPGRPGSRAVIAVAEGVQEALEAMAGLPVRLDDPVDGATALRLLLDELRGQAVPAPPEEEAVELLGWLELHLDDAPILLVTGVNEPHLPESVTGDAFLPHALRARLGLLDNDRRLARDLYQLRAMLASRPSLVLISGRRTGAGDPLRPSRLLLAEEGPRVARRLRDFLREEEEAGRGAEVPAGPEAGNGDPFSLPPEKEIRTQEAPDQLAVTRFRTLLQDPYRFGLEAIRGLESVDDQARELDPMGFGILAHEVLERFGRGEARASRDPGEVKEALDRLLDDEVRSRFGGSPHPAVAVQVEQLRARLHAFARWQADWVTQGWTTLGVEVEPPGRAHLFPVDDRPFHLRGRIDRVDHHPASGRWVLFDYKTSVKPRTPDETHRRKKGRKKDDPVVWVDLQLPLYRHLIREARDDRGGRLVPPEALDRVELGYILLPGDLEKVGEAIAREWTAADLREADELARELIRRLREGRFVWDPEASEIRADDPLAPLVGAGAYRDVPDDEEDGDG